MRCRRCGAELVKRKGAYGIFDACPNWPKCKGNGRTVDPEAHRFYPDHPDFYDEDPDNGWDQYQSGEDWGFDIMDFGDR